MVPYLSCPFPMQPFFIVFGFACLHLGGRYGLTATNVCISSISTVGLMLHDISGRSKSFAHTLASGIWMVSVSTWCSWIISWASKSNSIPARCTRYEISAMQGGQYNIIYISQLNRFCLCCSLGRTCPRICRQPSRKHIGHFGTTEKSPEWKGMIDAWSWQVYPLLSTPIRESFYSTSKFLT